MHRCAKLLALILIIGTAGARSATAASAAAAAEGAADPSRPENVLAHDVYRQLIEINTTESVGSVTAAAQAMAARLRGAGFEGQDLQLLGTNPRKQNLVARLHGTGAHRPILLIGHLDVVEAPRLEWATDPFKLVEKDGYFYGRGTEDMKDGDAILVTTFMRLKREGYRPDRDVILALTASEEGGSDNGVDYLVHNHRNLVDAEIVINEDGESVMTEHGVPQYYEIDATEKVYADFLLSTANAGGHSSLPVPSNAIYELAEGLARVQHYQFPFELNAVTRAYYERMLPRDPPARAAEVRGILETPPDPAAIAAMARNPVDNALERTTCVATRLTGGQANNALPQAATAIVNCRILPGHSPEEVRKTLIHVLNDPGVRVQYVADDGVTVLEHAPERTGYPAHTLPPQFLQPLERLVGEFWPGIPVVHFMSTGASDGVYTSAAGLPTYEITGIAVDRDDIRAHARNERIRVRSFYRGNAFFYRYLKAITGSPTG
ncbi:MAG TPA: M20/M25/M40 family metallo-hydrolase [Steroidobacteraceae bacterium]|nr:M20/M25/M40 family metallo-hydrolase [Steroidobacteraceae bacterium]